MRNVSHHIRTLLYEYDYVNLPNFGAFITNYSHTLSNEFSGSFLPPQKNVSFNEILKQDDGVLVLNIAKKENISFEDASKYVKSYIDLIRKNLEFGNSFLIESVGIFKLSKDKKLIFEPESKINFYGDSFGLDLVYPRKMTYNYTNSIETKTEFVFKPAKKSKAESYFKFLGVNLPFILLGALLTFVIIKNDTKTELSSLNPFTIFNNFIESKNSPKVKINNSIKRFKVATPYFSNLEDAKQVKLALIEDGFKNAEVFQTTKSIYVRVDVFFNENDALNFQDQLFKTYKQEFQILEQ